MLAIGAIAMTYLVGHSGAESVWKYKYAQAKAPIELNAGEISLDEVAQHNTNSDCWTVVNDVVYDVTTFVNRHPGGNTAIEAMCGINGSGIFLA